MKKNEMKKNNYLAHILMLFLISLVSLTIVNCSNSDSDIERSNLEEKFNIKPVQVLPEGVKPYQFKNTAELERFLTELQKPQDYTLTIGSDGKKSISLTKHSKTAKPKIIARTKSGDPEDGHGHVLIDRNIRDYRVGFTWGDTGVNSQTHMETTLSGFTLGVKFVESENLNNVQWQNDRTLKYHAEGNEQWYIWVGGEIIYYERHVEIDGYYDTRTKQSSSHFSYN